MEIMKIYKCAIFFFSVALCFGTVSGLKARFNAWKGLLSNGLFYMVLLTTEVVRKGK